MIQKFIIPPDRNGYSFSDGLETISTQLDGGASRYRLDILNANIKVNVQWTLTPDYYNYFRTFYNVITEKGSLPFLIDLYIDDAFQLTEHEAHFVPGTVGLKSQMGLSFVVGATLEVKTAPSGLVDNTSALLFGLFGSEYETYNDIFDNLINIEIPADLA